MNRETGVTEWSIALASSWAPLAIDGVLYVAGSDAISRRSCIEWHADLANCP